MEVCVEVSEYNESGLSFICEDSSSPLPEDLLGGFVNKIG